MNLIMDMSWCSGFMVPDTVQTKRFFLYTSSKFSVIWNRGLWSPLTEQNDLNHRDNNNTTNKMHSFSPLSLWMFFQQPGKQQDPLRTSDAQETRALSVFDLVFVAFLETASLFVLSGSQGVDARWHADPRVINKIPIFFFIIIICL